MKTIIFIACILCLSQNLIAQKEEPNFYIKCESSNYGKAKYVTFDLEDNRLKKENGFTVGIKTSDFHVLDSVLSHLKTATELSIESDSLVELGTEIIKLKKLKFLYIYCPELESLPKNIDKLLQLDALQISRFKFQNCPLPFQN